MKVTEENVCDDKKTTTTAVWVSGAQRKVKSVSCHCN